MSPSWPTAVVLLGCGNMGRALLGGWLDQGLPASALAVVEPSAEQACAAAERGVAVYANPGSLVSGGAPEVVVLAVKPQIMDAVLPGCLGWAAQGAVSLSIAAGRTIAGIECGLGSKPAVVRAMPNTPAAIRRGISVACANERTSGRQRTLCETLLAAVGSVVWVEDESLLDPVTAVSGSGPAYVFLLAECLAEAGVAAGLPKEIAVRLARETVAGAGELLARSSGSPESLRQAVTSPGGTTAAALSILMNDRDGFSVLMSRAVEAATKRARELAG